VVELRPYQVQAVQSIYDYYSSGNSGNCLIVLPTGAGKSLVMAAFIKGALEQYPGTRVLLLTHVRELIQQDTNAIIRYWPEAPVGIWSAGLGQKRKNLITVAGIQSIHRLPAKFSDTNLVIVDEAHLIPRSSETMYGRFLAGVRHYNQAMKVVGLTATPFRTDSGLLTHGESRIFTDIAYEANVGDLIKDGYLCPLIAKRAAAGEQDVSGVHTRGGEFIASELQEAVDKDDLINGALNEVARLAADRRHILGFCAGVEHARHCAEAAIERGWTADYVTGDMDNGDRDRRIARFKSGQTRILFNAMLLTTGFDFPSIDCILMLRPTQSVGLYVQIMGRGLRKDGIKENTLVLDFAGNILRHGPIDRIRGVPSRGQGKGDGLAPAKSCPSCGEIVHTSVMLCPGCGHVWERAPSHGTEAAEGVVVAALEKPRVYKVDTVEYAKHEKVGKAPSMKVTYHCGPSAFSEWVPIEDDRSYVRKHAVHWFWKRGAVCPGTVDEALQMVPRIPAPDEITVKLDGRYWRVLEVEMGSRRMDVSSLAGNWFEEAF